MVIKINGLMKSRADSIGDMLRTRGIPHLIYQYSGGLYTLEVSEVELQVSILGIWIRWDNIPFVKLRPDEYVGIEI